MRRPSGGGPPRPGRPQRRLRVATVLALAMFALIAGRLVVLQFTDAKAYAAEGLRERLTTEVIPAPRGAILDRDGKILAHSVEARYVYADPAMVENVEATADALAPLLGRVGIARSELVTEAAPAQAQGRHRGAVRVPRPRGRHRTRRRGRAAEPRRDPGPAATSGARYPATTWPRR